MYMLLASACTKGLPTMLQLLLKTKCIAAITAVPATLAVQREQPHLVLLQLHLGAGQ
jgi:hypothetical protein